MDWGHRFHSTISYKTKAGFSDGDLTWSSLLTAKCRVQQHAGTFRALSGEELSTTHVLYTTTDIPEGARVWLPGRTTSDDSESLPVLVVESSYTLDGNYTLRKLTLGR